LFSSQRLLVAVQVILKARNDCNLFSRLFIACQVRNGDLDVFFQHEHQLYPPSTSDNGTLCFCSKSDLLECFENVFPSSQEKPSMDVLILDGAAIINMLPPGQSNRTFSDYASNVFVPHILSKLNQVKRVDAVWDQYSPDSLKAATHTKRGSEVQCRISSLTVLPRN